MEKLDSKLKVLLVDDSEAILRHVSGLLGRLGLDVQRANNLPAALVLCSRYKPDLVLVDFVLGSNLTGLAALSAIFAAMPAGQKKPGAALLTSGRLPPDDEQKAKADKIEILQKPKHGKEEDFLQNVQFWLKDLTSQS